MLEEIFGTRKPILGVVHLLPLPGSPRWDGQVETICLRGEQEAVALASGGVDGIIVENFFDAPFTKERIDAATISAFALAVKRIMSLCELPIGINCLRNDGLSALAIAATTGAQFIRVNVFTGAVVADQGIIEGQARELLLYRRSLMAQKRIKIFADIMVKHAAQLGTGSDIRLIAKDTFERGLADALIVSGVATGSAPNDRELKEVKQAVPDCPVLAGSGCSKDNIEGILGVVDGVIVASSLKREGVLENPIDVDRVRALVKAARAGGHQLSPVD
jgi:membrane complex biogenesis BtpA family protein